MAQAQRLSLKNILLSTDFSSASDAALPYAVEIARQFQAKVYVAHVVFPELYESLPEQVGQKAVAQAKEHAEEKMRRLLSSGPLAEVPHQGTVLTGEIWDELACLIKEAKIDLVASGTHGRRGTKKLLLGSVAEEIFRLSPVPVLTVGPSVAGSLPRRLRSILHPTDFSTHSWRAAEYALALGEQFHSCLTWMHVARLDGGDSPNRSRLQHFFSERLRELLPPQTSEWCRPEYRVEFGDPVEKIISAAGQTGADLIVMGIWGAGALARATTHAGNTGYRVVSQAPVPVLTVRGPSSEIPGPNAYES